MANHSQDSGEFLLDLAARKEQQLPWVKKYINTTITLVGTVATVATLILGMGLNLDPAVVAVLVGVVKIAEVLGVRSSKPQPTVLAQKTWRDLLTDQIDECDHCSESR